MAKVALVVRVGLGKVAEVAPDSQGLGHGGRQGLNDMRSNVCEIIKHE